MTVVTAQRRAREKEMRRQAILDAARQALLSNSLRRMSMEEIAARAEISKGTVYLYFANKETLLAHLLLEGLGILLHSLKRAYEKHKDDTPEVRLRAMSQAYLAFSQHHEPYFQLMTAFDKGQFQERIPSDLYQQVLNRSKEGLVWVDRAIREGAERGDFRLMASSWHTAGAFWAALNGSLLLLAHPLRREMIGLSQEQLFLLSQETFIRGLHSHIP